jgi:polyisoprenoid-binding protein YceI
MAGGTRPLPPTRRRRRWARWLIAAAVAVVAVVVGGPFVYIHFIEGKAPAPLSLSTTTTATGGAPTSSAAAPASSSPAVQGRWHIAAGSIAGYRIQETLFGQSKTAVGRTSHITGSITVSGTSVTAGSFSVEITTVKSDQSLRDEQFQGRIMDTSAHPTATFILTQPIQLGSIPAPGATITKTATGRLTLHGTTRSVTFQIQARRNGSTISVSGSIPIVFADYGIQNPSGGPATTANHGLLEFLLNLSHT